VGTRRLIDHHAIEAAKWYPLPGGQAVWSLRLRSPSAVGLRVHFDHFSVGTGKVWVLDGGAGKTKFFGPYTGKGPLESGEFWTEVLFSETIEIEYVPEQSGYPGGDTPFQIVSISHLWDVHSLSRGATTQAATAQAATAVNYSCFLDAPCDPTYQIAATPTLEIYIELPTGVQAVCSGTLVRTVGGSGAPYLLTAGHCVPARSTATSLVAIWNYETSACNGTAPNLASLPQQTGATLLSFSANPFNLDYSFEGCIRGSERKWGQRRIL
jgi:hypothetical protein